MEHYKRAASCCLGMIYALDKRMNMKQTLPVENHYGDF